MSSLIRGEGKGKPRDIEKGVVLTEFFQLIEITDFGSLNMPAGTVLPWGTQSRSGLKRGPSCMTILFLSCVFSDPSLPRLRRLRALLRGNLEDLFQVPIYRFSYGWCPRFLHPRPLLGRYSGCSGRKDIWLQINTSRTTSLQECAMHLKMKKVEACRERSRSPQRIVRMHPYF